MNALPLHKPWTIEDFLDWENRQEERHELIDGKIVAMVGETIEHNRIAGNLDRSLAAGLRGTGCSVFREGIKLRVNANIYYPDIIVTCTRAAGRDTLSPDPIVVCEVLSPSTERRDRIVKNRAYRTLASLQQYVLVAQDAISVESFVRRGDLWVHEPLDGPGAVLRLPALDLEVPLADIFADTDLLAEAQAPVAE